jgi:hypothetical protein
MSDERNLITHTDYPSSSKSLVGGKQQFKFVCGDRRAKQVALHGMTTALPQEVKLLLGFHSFGNDFKL